MSWERSLKWSCDVLALAENRLWNESFLTLRPTYSQSIFLRPAKLKVICQETYIQGFILCFAPGILNNILRLDVFHRSLVYFRLAQAYPMGEFVIRTNVFNGHPCFLRDARALQLQWDFIAGSLTFLSRLDSFHFRLVARCIPDLSKASSYPISKLVKLNHSSELFSHATRLNWHASETLMLPGECSRCMYVLAGDRFSPEHQIEGYLFFEC